MSISDQSQAVLLLTAWFSKPAKGEPKPLTPKEWGRFALWLKDKGLSPEALLRSSDISHFLEGWSDRSIDERRIRHLLERAGALGIALEKWQRAGLWVMTRSDPDYPSRLKKLLKIDAPPVLFGSGNRQLLDKGGIAVVGSRDASPEDLVYSFHVGEQIALQGRSVVSGGARGVDESAMLGALEQDGTAIGVLADSLLRASNSAKYRRGLMDKNLALVSPFNPEAGFDVGNAMARNKYIYCMADAAVVVSTSKDKGGTWSGATENLKQKWVPLWVKFNKDTESGNAGLEKKGAQWLSDELQIDILCTAPSSIEEPEDWPLRAQSLNRLEVREKLPVLRYSDTLGSGSDVAEEHPAEMEMVVVAAEAESRHSTDLSMYEYFLQKIEVEIGGEPIWPEVLQERLQLGKTQLNDWLKRAVSEGRLEKLGKPVRYQLVRALQHKFEI
jgi:predicted Rossmann fold nucleotide-binding protein DprA/Smf involved in DNA uptake